MLGCDQMFYYPNQACYGTPEHYRLEYESVTFAAANGPRLHGWFFPAQRGDNPRQHGDGSNHDPGRHACGTVLHLHGNAGNITGHFQHVAWLPAQGWNVLCFDYRGYGRSQGTVTRAGTIEDAHAALDYLLSRGDLERGKIVAFGQSLGGAIGVVLTAERSEIRGLAADGAFDSYRGIASWHIRHNPLLLPVAWWVPKVLMSEGHNPIDYVDRISPRPLLLMHGTADQVVDPAMSRRLYQAAGEPKELWLVQGADHYGAMQDLAKYSHPKLLNFFTRCLNSPTSRGG